MLPNPATSKSGFAPKKESITDGSSGSGSKTNSGSESSGDAPAM